MGFSLFTRTFNTAVVVCGLAALSFAGVSVSSPSPGSSDSSPVHFAASAAGNHPIIAMMIYVDNQSVYKTSGASINTNVNLGGGTHYIVVQAWDSTGAVYKANGYNITVNGSSGTGGGGTGSPTYGMIQAMSGWTTCGSCAGSAAISHSMSQYISNPSMTGKSTQYWNGANVSYGDAIWWKQLGANSGASHFIYDFYFYANNPGVAQALEFDMNQSVNGRKFIFGTQCDIKGAHQWDVWDTANGRWVQTGIGCSTPPAYTWNHVILEFQRVGSQTNFVSVTLNGNKSYINRTFNTYGVNASELNTAVQLDGDGSRTPFSIWVDNMQVTAW